MATPKKVPFLHEVEAQLRQLAGPLNVTLAKLANNKSTPLPMWPKPNGFTPEEVISIGPNLLEWCGGGTSLLNVLDVDGKSVQCQVYYPTDIYPEKVPQQLAHNLRQQAVPVTVPAQTTYTPSYAAQAQTYTAPVIPLQQPQVIQVAQPIAAAAGGSAMSTDYTIPPGVAVRGATFGQAAAQAPAPTWSGTPEVRVVERPRNDEDRIRLAEEAAQREREARKDLEAKMERDRLESTHQKQLEGMKEEIRRVHEKSTAPDETVRAVMDTVKELASEVRNLKDTKREEASSTGMASVLTAMMQMQAQAQQQQAQMQQQSQQQMMQLLAALNAKPQGMDPTVQVLIESMRSDREAARERERSDREARREEALVRREEAREREKSTLGPRDIMDMMKEARASSGVDAVMKPVTDIFGTMVGMMKQQAELVQQINGGGAPHPAVELLGGAINGVQEMAKQYFSSKQTIEVAQAQVRAMEARARMTPEPAQLPPQPHQVQQVQQAPNNVVPLRPQPAAAPEQPAVPAQMSSHEQQLFGVPILMQKIEELRGEVSQARVTPEQVVGFIRTAQVQLRQANLLHHVRVYELFDQGLFDDFARALLPNAPQPYIIELVNLLAKAAANPHAPLPSQAAAAPSQRQEENEEEDDEDEEEDEDDL